jgi:hypothetical protein
MIMIVFDEMSYMVSVCLKYERLYIQFVYIP